MKRKWCPLAANVSASRVRLVVTRSMQIDFNWVHSRKGDYSNRLVHAHNLCWGRVLEKAFDECKIGRFERTRKGNFLPSFKFFRVDFVIVTCRCNGGGYAFDNIDFVVYIEENSCHLELSVLTLDQNWRWIFGESFDERIM